MSGKVLSNRFHTRFFHTSYPGIGEAGDSFWIVMESAIADYATYRISNIEYRRKTQINAVMQ